MSDPPRYQPAPDPNRAKVAPPPPPPLAVAAGHTAAQGAGFAPRGQRLVLEVLAAVLLIGLASVIVIVAGGRIAAWSLPVVPWEVDRKIGELANKQVGLTSEECTDPAALAYVQKVAAPLIQAAGKVPFQFQFRVADTEDVNAFALPGGYVTVNFGLLKSAQTGEEVAGVLGHELQHALLRHGTKRMLRQMGSSAFALIVFGGGDLYGIGQAAGQLASLSYDRGEESEADERGVELLVHAGIDPRGLASFFKRLAADSLQVPELLSTHPDPGGRAELVERAARSAAFQKLPSPQGLHCHEDKSSR